MCLSGDAWDHPPIGAGLVGQTIAAADYALLHDFIAWVEAPVRRQTGEARRAARAAGRAVVGVIWGQHEVPTVHARRISAAEQHHMVDQFAVLAHCALRVCRVPDTDAEVGQRRDVAGFDRQRTGIDQKEPVAAVGDVTPQGAEAGNVDFTRSVDPAAFDVGHGNGLRVFQREPDCAGRGIDLMLSQADPTQMRQRHPQPDRAVPAHAEHGIDVEEDHPGDRAFPLCWLEQGTDHGNLPAWLTEDRAAEIRVLRRQPARALGHGTGAEVWTAIEDDPRGFTARMAVDYLH